VLEGEFVDIPLVVNTNQSDVTFSVVDGVCPAPLTTNGRINGQIQPVNQSVNFTFTVRAQTANVLADRVFSIFVTAVPKSPVWQNDPNLGNLFPNQPFYLSFNVESNNPLNLSYAVLGTLPVGLVLSGATIQGTISNSNPEGNGSFRVEATDGTFTVPITFFYRIIKSNFPPVWQSAANLGSFTQGQNINLKLLASDINNDVITYDMPFGQGAVFQAAILNGKVLPPTVLNPGTNYTNSPPSLVSFYSGTSAQATATVSAGEVDELTVVDPGSNYAKPPVVILTGGGGFGADFKAITNGGQVIGFEKISGGNGYTSPPTVSFATFLNPAVGSALIVEGQVTGIELISEGDGYLFPPVVRVESPPPPIGGGSLPLGLRLNADGTLTGSISMQAEPKTYNFVVTASDGVNPPVAQTFSLSVTPFSVGNLSTSISWITASGLLGDTFERYPSYFAVRAQASNTQLIEYTLAPGSNPLPPGITLQQSNGTLTGWFEPVANNTTFEFTVRAQVVGNPSIFSDRSFSIQVLQRFTTTSENYWYNFTGPDKIQLFSDIFENINSVDIFNFNSTDFGIVRVPRLLISGGCVEQTDAQTWNFMRRQEDEFGNPIPNSTYHLPLQLIFGNIRVVSIIPPNATLPIADAIVADIVDPGEVTKSNVTFGAGGWEGTQNIGVATNNPLSPVIYPTTLTNIRLAFRNQIGYAGNEFLPWFMTKSGYRPAIDIVYVRPGRGQFNLEKLQPVWNQKYLGKILTLDRYYKTTQTNQNIRIFNFDVDIV
jgi:hypothetical protein